MLITILNWVHSLLHEYYAPTVLSDETIVDSLPGPDPSQQQSSLTLPPHRAHNLEAPPPPSSHSPFFQRLPGDLRRLILLEAFGDRILHIDLQHCYAPQPVHEPFRLTSCYRYYYCRRPPAWRWAGCVCHRDPEWRVRGQRQAFGGANSVSEPRKDGCLVGLLYCQACQHWAGSKPGKCRVGVMGWLRSCRQA